MSFFETETKKHIQSVGEKLAMFAQEMAKRGTAILSGSILGLKPDEFEVVEWY